MGRTATAIALVALIILVIVMATIVALARAAGGGAPATAGGGGGAPAVHILVPFRAGADQPERAKQLEAFLGHFAGWAAEPGHDVHIIEQGDDQMFNRGALLNAGFDLVAGAEGPAADRAIFVFHDVDLLPDAELLAHYADPPPVHFAAGWDRYGAGNRHGNYLGGILSVTGAQFRDLGGFPNDFYGWGGEDDELRERLKRRGLFRRVKRPRAGGVTDLEEMDLGQKLAVLKQKKLKCPFKIERREGHRADRLAGRPPRGLAEIRDVYIPAGAAEKQPGVTVHTVCLRTLPPHKLAFAAPLESPGGAPSPPHADDFQRRLESQVAKDLAMYGATPDAYDRMRAFAKDHVKYLRSCVFVEAGETEVRCEIPDPDANVWGEHLPDSRTRTFAFMVRELVAWCHRYGLRFPRGRFVIYVTDTYAWEEGAADLPWMVVARPQNRKGLLLPDNSFVTHGETNDNVRMRPGMTWAWDDLVARAAKLKRPVRMDRALFFRGADTGADKYATRRHLATRRRWAVPTQIALFGPKNTRRESVLSWNRHGVLLNLPGHQPWSYRLKYLFLTRRPVFNVDVEVAYRGDERTTRWVQFFDRVFRPGVDFVRFTVRDKDRASQRERRAESERLARDLEREYGALDEAKADAMAGSAFRKASELSSSRLLQYMHRLFTDYAAKFA